MVNQQGKPFEEMTLEEVHAMRDAMPEGFGMSGTPEPVARVEEAGHRDPGRLGGRADLLASRRRASARFDVLPWRRTVPGNPAWVDGPCRSLANGSGAIVVSVDYRLAPEHRYPTAAEDCYAVTKYVAEHPEDFAADPSRLAVAGDSAGRSTAAVVLSDETRDRGRPLISYQLLVYPYVDYLDASPSMTENAQGIISSLGTRNELVLEPICGCRACSRALSVAPSSEELRGTPAGHGVHGGIRSSARPRRTLRQASEWGRASPSLSSVPME